MFLREPLSESELNFVKTTEYFDNEESCRTFIPELEVEIEKVKIIKLLMEKFNQDFYHYGYTFDTETMTPGGFD